MLITSIKLMLALTVMLALTTAIILLAKKTESDREKMSPFECGFEPMKSARLPFSLRFFLVALIFLIFDVEISLLLPLPLIMKITPLHPLIYTSILFLIILTAGLFYEWNSGALDWS
uniref:NADH-ubiquinone oxidoreductase chain 3 n=1 Tax=Strigamia maritima TaxID=126957 RepID=A0A0C5AR22_STRMM|nr:NADH dehydrogenase subunit 3 [Strigamia maritima]AJK90883.1 NADH dehydrogenase subunit 3 [Strigamia maritima]